MTSRKLKGSEPFNVDLVGEVANTISGNARASFGQEFMISASVMIEGAPGTIHLPPQMRSYVIPIYWKAYHAAVVICLESDWVPMRKAS